MSARGFFSQTELAGCCIPFKKKACSDICFRTQLGFVTSSCPAGLFFFCSEQIPFELLPAQPALAAPVIDLDTDAGLISFFRVFSFRVFSSFLTLESVFSHFLVYLCVIFKKTPTTALAQQKVPLSALQLERQQIRQVSVSVFVFHACPVKLHQQQPKDRAISVCPSVSAPTWVSRVFELLGLGCDSSD